MREKRIVLVNDVTGLSRCSVACQLPIISSMGIETAFVPTAVTMPVKKEFQPLVLVHPEKIWHIWWMSMWNLHSFMGQWNVIMR